jgi:predicted TIM-barrel fold metal-dependent hydrolase
MGPNNPQLAGANPETNANPRRIDVHHHMLPPEYANLTRDRILEITSGDTTVLKWTPAVTLEQMEQFGVASSILSLPVPGAWYEGKENSRKLARIANEYGARLSKDYPGRFGMFAAIPLPDVDGSLAEIEYAFEILKADGIYLQTSYDDKWPGDPAFAAVFDELNLRKAIVFVHPTEPSCCASLIPGIPSNVIEFVFDTTRAITSFLVNGTFSRCPDIRFIFCHSGGTMPVLAARINGFFAARSALASRVPNGVLYELKKLNYDIANATNSSSLAALMNLVPTTQIVFGSDFPYRAVAPTANGWDSYQASDEVKRAVNRDNALKLFPRFADK